MNYDPKFSVKQIYDQYSSSRNTTKTNPNQQFAQTMQAGGGGRNMSGIGAPRTFPKGSTYDEVPDKPEETGFTKTISNFFSSLFDSGADEDSFSNIGKVNVTPVSLYETDQFAYDPTRYTRGIDIERQDARIDNMLYNRSDDPGYKRDEYAGSTYDEVLKQIKPEKAPVNVTDQINESVRKGIMATTPTGTYKIQGGDTLSEIAAATGTTVDFLKKLNKIENENVIEAGADLKIPVQTTEQKEVVSNATSMKELSTMKEYKPTQSGVPVELRTEPEGEFSENFPRDRELMINTGTPSYNFMAEGSKYTEALKKREADNYDTIFGNAESKRTPFKGTKVSDMTLDEVLEFTKLNGKFHNYNKKKGHNTTAVGKYQLVGSTLRDLNSKERGVLKKLGITGDTKFDEKTQDSIAAYLAVHRLKDRATGETGGDVATRASARKEMRNEWQGLNKLSNDELDEIIDEIASEIDLDIVDVVPTTSARPKPRPLGKP